MYRNNNYGVLAVREVTRVIQSSRRFAELLKLSKFQQNKMFDRRLTVIFIDIPHVFVIGTPHGLFPTSFTSLRKDISRVKTYRLIKTCI